MQNKTSIQDKAKQNIYTKQLCKTKHLCNNKTKTSIQNIGKYLCKKQTKHPCKTKQSIYAKQNKMNIYAKSIYQSKTSMQSKTSIQNIAKHLCKTNIYTKQNFNAKHKKNIYLK